MTLVSFVGPFVLIGVLQGGASGKWPPDRPVEWAVVIVVFGLVSRPFPGVRVPRLVASPALFRQHPGKSRSPCIMGNVYFESLNLQ